MTAAPILSGVGPDQARALDVARGLARAGVPLFIAKPDPHQPGEFWRPNRWQWTPVDRSGSVVDTWRPGDALCALMGVMLDLADIDPRHGGDASWAAMASAGVQPTVWAESATPSGGKHLFVARLRTGSRDRIRPGVDIKGGRDGLIESAGRGLAYIAPTVRFSKVTGEAAVYRWVTEPLFLDDDLMPDAGMMADLEADETGAELAEIVRAELGSNVVYLRQRGGAPAAPDPLRTFDTAQAVEYVQAQLGRLAAAQEGTRNRTLFESALLVGHFVPAFMDEAEAVDLLRRAVACCGLDDDPRQIAKTIRSGMERGMSEPYLRVPDAPVLPTASVVQGPPSVDAILDPTVPAADGATAAGEIGGDPGPAPSIAATVGVPSVADGLDQAQAVFEFRVAEEVARQEVRDEARRRLASRGRQDVPEAVSLANALTVQFDDEPWRIPGLLAVEGINLLSAAQKAGKTTLMGNLVRSLADGDKFLDHFPVESTGIVTLIDTELSTRRLYEWTGKQGIKATDRVRLMSLRGHEGSLDPRDPECRKVWVPILTGSGVVILDVVGPCLAALGLDENENADVGAWWTGFRTLLIEASVPTGLVVHHTGHNEARAIGASSWLRYPDAIWKLEREDDDPMSPRYFSAYGRDVDVRPGQLTFDSSSRRLAYSGVGKSAARSSRWLTLIVEALRERGPLGQTQCVEMLRAEGVSRDNARDVLSYGAREKVLISWPGAGRSIVYGLAHEHGHLAARSVSAPSGRARMGHPEGSAMGSTAGVA